MMVPMIIFATRISGALLQRIIIGADREVSLNSKGTTTVIGGMMNCNGNSMN
jgi:hypothetical protein